MKSMLTLFSICMLFSATAQKDKQVSIAFVNTASAHPFKKLGSLITGIHHPGVEVGYSFNWKTRKKHDWYQEIKAGYFYHRFVQHGIPLYTDFGYRYKFPNGLTGQAALGAGYLHSIPATKQFELTESGEYKTKKSLGRMQAMAVLNVGFGYLFAGKRPIKIFTTYQQQLQMPFIKSYVPILPYNSLLLGVSVPCTSLKN